jgi:hypothetical protein
MRFAPFVLAAILLCPHPARGEGRLPVSDNSADTDFKDALSAAAKAFDSEDLNSFESCFSEQLRKGMRRKMAVLFASHECSMELVEAHTIEVDEHAAEAAVRYRVGGVGETYEFVSVIKAVKEDGRWVIDSELKIRGVSSGEPTQRSYATSSPKKAKAAESEEVDKSEVDPAIRHLIGDMDVMPGSGCVGGQCRIRRNGS